MGYHLWIIIVFLIPSASFGITDFHQRSHRRHIGTFYPKTPSTYWETGLKDSVYRTFLRKGYVDPSLKDQILNAPLILTQYKPQGATPFGDIAVLARGQLYFSAGGFEFVQDEHSYDCDECRREQPLLRFDRGQIVALWTVKRLRHHDQNGYHRYETEYLISLGSGDIFKSNGAFNYDIPGYIFILKDARVQSNNFWNRENPSWYKQDEGKQFEFDNGRYYLPPVFSTATTPSFYYYVTPKAHFNHDPDIIPAKNNVQKEIELYNMLLQSLKQAQPSEGVRFPGATTTKPFKPSPTYIKYSEPDPLYTTTRTPPTTTTTKIHHTPPTTTERALTITPFLPTPVSTRHPEPNLLHTTTKMPPTTAKIDSTMRTVYQKTHASTIKQKSEVTMPSTTTQKSVMTSQPMPTYTKYSELHPLYTTTKAPPALVRIETTTRNNSQSSTQIPKIIIPPITTQKPITTTFDIFDVFLQPKHRGQPPQNLNQTIMRKEPTKYSPYLVSQTIPADSTVNIQTTTARTPTSIPLQNKMAETTTMISVPTRTTSLSPASLTTARTTTTKTPTTFTLVQTQSHFSSTVKFSTKLPSATTESPFYQSTVVKSSTELPKSTIVTHIEPKENVFTTTTQSPFHLSTIFKSSTELPKPTLKTQTSFTETTQSPSYLSTISKLSTELPKTTLKTQNSYTETTESSSYLSTILSSTELPKSTVKATKVTSQNIFTKITPTTYSTTPTLTETTQSLTTMKDVTENPTAFTFVAPESVLDQQTSFTETKYVATSTITPTTTHLFTETTLDERTSMNTTPKPIRKYTKIPMRTQIKTRIDNKSSVTETTEQTPNFNIATAKFSTTDNIISTTIPIQETETGILSTTSQNATDSTTLLNVENQTRNPLQTTILSATTNHFATQIATSATSVNSGEVFDEIFGKFSKEIITHTTPSTPKKVVTLNPDLAEEIFGVSPRSYEGDSAENESAQIEQIVTTQAENSPKIIFDNFFEASTFPTTEANNINLETTTPPTVETTDFRESDNFSTSTTDLATEQTTIYPEITTAGNVESLKNDAVQKGDDNLEITKIITIQIHNVTKPDKRDTYNISEDVLKADVTKINVGDDHFLIYKAVVDGKDMIKISNSTREETDLFDNLALSVINHAKSINYLNRKKHRSRRKKVYKLKTRIKGKTQ